MNWYDDKTVVVRVKADELEKAKTFFEGFGLKFVQEKHGEGPVHYSCQVGERVFEIYPKREVDSGSDIPPSRSA